MAKYYTSVETIGAIAGVEEPIQVRNVTITNVDEGQWNGLFIEAKNFAIANGNLASSASETYLWNALGSAWTADIEVNQVVFTNNGTIGTQDNTVNMAITFDAFTPSASADIDITLVESTDHPIYAASHPFETSATWGAQVAGDDALHTVITSTAYTESASTGTGATYSGTILTDNAAAVVLVTFATIDEHYYSQGVPDVQVGGILGAYGLYSAQVEDETYNTDNLLIGFKVRVEFNWNALGESETGAEWFQPAYTDDYTQYTEANNITVAPIYISPIPVLLTGDRIHSVSYSPSVTSSQGETAIRVFGSANAPYKISVEKKTSTTSSVTASSDGYYNFDTRAFQTAVTSLDSACNAKGTNVNYVLLPDVTSDTRYDVVISGVVAGSTTVLNSSVPQKAGDATITKYGVDTITIKPITYTDPTPYGALPANITISKQKPIPGKSSGSASLTSVIVKGGTGGASSKRLVLNETASGIFSGMVVTGSGVAHNSTVTAVSKNVVTLSALSTIANNTDIRFTENTVNLKPFTFTVVPTGGNTLNVTSTADKRGSIGGLTSVKTRINGANKNTATFTVDSTKGIVPGMVVTGSEVKVDAGTDLTVDDVTSATVLVFSEIQAFSDNALLKFSGGNVVADTSLHSIQVNKVSSNIVITGYIVSSNINATADVRVYIDDLITVN